MPGAIASPASVAASVAASALARCQELTLKSVFVLSFWSIGTRGLAWLYHVKAVMHQGQNEQCSSLVVILHRADPLKPGCSGEEGGNARDASKGNP